MSERLGLLHSNQAINPRITSGRWYRSVGIVSTVGVVVAHEMYLIPFWPGKAGTIDGIAFEVTTQGVSASGTDHLRIGLYADDGSGLPTGAALFDSGQQNLEVATGVKTVSVSWTNIKPTLYWMATVRQTTGTIATAAQLRRYTASEMGRHFLSDATATPVIGSTEPLHFLQTGVTGALPTIGSVSLGTAFPTIVLWKFA